MGGGGCVLKRISINFFGLFYRSTNLFFRYLSNDYLDPLLTKLSTAPHAIFDVAV